MSYNADNIKENYEICSIKLAKNFFVQDISYLQAFKFLIEKKMLPIGLYRETNSKTKEFLMIPDQNEKLNVLII